MTETESIKSKKVQSEAVINKYLPWSMGAGLIPVPAFDAAAVCGIQIKMLSEISRIYGVEFSENAGKSIIGSLLGGVGATSIAAGTFGSIVKAIPGFGSILGATTLPIVAGATTFAIGKVFIQHFESGGTFLNFDSIEGKKIFDEKFAEGSNHVKQLVDKVDKKISSVVDF